MGRYVKRFTRLGSAGPTEERGFAIWAGYDIVGVDADLSALGLTSVDGWSEDRIRALGITTFLRITPDDEAALTRLGLKGNR